MKMQLATFMLSFLGLHAAFALNTSSECLRTRAAIDMGSGSFRLTVAKVDICEQKILETLLSESEKTGFKSDLDHSMDQTLSEGAIQKGLKVANDFVVKAQTLGATEFYAVGTEVFRVARNAHVFIESFPRNVLVRIISQEEEAKLGFFSALTQWQGKQKNIMVWDIGGGSAQFVTRNSLGKINFTYTKTASSSAKRIAKALKGNTAAETPNPIGQEHLSQLVLQLQKEAEKDLAGLHKTKRMEVIGIGSIHYSSVHRQASKQNGYYTAEQVEAALKEQSEKNDEQIGGKYAASDATNLALILSYMKALKIKKVSVLDVSLTEGLLVRGIK